MGSVAFGEPFHISYFHHSPLAVFELLDSCGLDADLFVLSDRYSAFYAHLEMGFAGQRIPRSIHGVIAKAVREVGCSRRERKASSSAQQSTCGLPGQHLRARTQPRLDSLRIITSAVAGVFWVGDDAQVAAWPDSGERWRVRG